MIISKFRACIPTWFVCRHEVISWPFEHLVQPEMVATFNLELYKQFKLHSRQYRLSFFTFMTIDHGRPSYQVTDWLTDSPVYVLEMPMHLIMSEIPTTQAGLPSHSLHKMSWRPRQQSSTKRQKNNFYTKSSKLETKSKSMSSWPSSKP